MLWTIDNEPGATAKTRRGMASHFRNFWLRDRGSLLFDLHRPMVTTNPAERIFGLVKRTGLRGRKKLLPHTSLPVLLPYVRETRGAYNVVMACARRLEREPKAPQRKHAEKVSAARYQRTLVDAMVAGTIGDHIRVGAQDGEFLARPSNNRGSWYRVNCEGTCTCPDWQQKRHCRHCDGIRGIEDDLRNWARIEKSANRDNDSESHDCDSDSDSSEKTAGKSQIGESNEALPARGTENDGAFLQWHVEFSRSGYVSSSAPSTKVS